MNEKVAFSELLDFYGALLTDKQQEVCRYYYDDDLSLQEIAEMENISRAAVYDMIKRCRDDLKGYEEKLHLLASWKKRRKLYQMIREKSDEEVGRLVDECIETEME